MTTEFHELERLDVGFRCVRAGIGDITRQHVGALVNAANEFLQHGGGVAGAIVRAGGEVIQQESNRWGYVPVGNATTTSAGNLPARFVIHAVGPRGGDSYADEKLFFAIWSALREAEILRCSTIAIPPVSTGIFGFPKEKGCTIIAEAAVRFLRERADHLRDILLIDHDSSGAELFAHALVRLQAEG